MKVCLVRYNEIALKGKNLRSFEDLLLNNIRSYLTKNKIKFDKIQKSYKRILIDTDNNCGFLKRIFGIASFSHAIESDLNLDEIKKKVLILANKIKFKTFRVSARRANKKFSYNSLQLNCDVGDLIRTKLNKKVDLNNFDLDVGIEILNKGYIFVDKVKGPGGLPLGIEGSVVSLIENRENVLASYLIMKRGCNIIPVAYRKFNLGLLRKFDFNLKIKIVKNIKEIEKIAKEHNAKALVSEQTLENFKDIKTKVVVLRPLIGLSEKETEDKLISLGEL